MLSAGYEGVAVCGEASEKRLKIRGAALLGAVFTATVFDLAFIASEEEFIW